MYFTIYFLIFILLAIFFHLENNTLTITKFKLTSGKIKEKINIVQISDLHGKSFGKNNDKLIEKIKNEKPDFILYTGDLTNGRAKGKTDYVGINLLSKLNKIIPVFYINGNHEFNGGERVEKLIAELSKNGVNVLQNKIEQIEINNSKVFILGLEEGLKQNTLPLLKKFETENSLKILLCHYPEFFKYYCKFDIDFMFSGHAHGGQFIFPFIGGLYAPGQGIFPKYYRGIHKKNNSTLIVSRGLGPSRFPQRLFNKPEIISLEITTK